MVVKRLTAHKFQKDFCHLISKEIKGVTDWFPSLYKGLRGGVITELNNMLFLLLYLKEMITEIRLGIT